MTRWLGTNVEQKLRYHLWRQRMRWRNNIIKILRQQALGNMLLVGRYGVINAIIADATDV